jgi:hypothetical protein
MVDVFRTDVADRHSAQLLIELIHVPFPEYLVSFDLEDREKILRVQSETPIDIDGLVALLNKHGVWAEALEDTTINS